MINMVLIMIMMVFMMIMIMILRGSPSLDKGKSPGMGMKYCNMSPNWSVKDNYVDYYHK